MNKKDLLTYSCRADTITLEQYEFYIRKNGLRKSPLIADPSATPAFRARCMTAVGFAWLLAV